MNGDTLHVHGERSLSEVGGSASPLAGAISGRGWLVGSSVGTSNPVAHLDFHWCLWKVLAFEGESITVVKCTHKVAIDGPFDISRSPVDSVGVPGTDRVSDIVVDGPVVGCGVALSKEVALHRRVRRPQPFPVNLIEVIRFKNETADDTGAWGSLHNSINLSEKNVFVAGNCGSIRLRVDRELSTVCSV